MATNQGLTRQLSALLASLALNENMHVSSVTDHLDREEYEPTGRRIVTIDGWIFIDELEAILRDLPDKEN